MRQVGLDRGGHDLGDEVDGPVTSCAPRAAPQGDCTTYDLSGTFRYSMKHRQLMMLPGEPSGSRG